MSRLLRVLLLISCLLLTSNFVFAQATHIYDSWNGDAVSNNPSIFPIMTITRSWKITKIGDYHYNFGAGQDPGAVNGNISLYNNTSGALIGSWAASTVANLDDAGNHCLGPNMCWAAYPKCDPQAGQLQDCRLRPVHLVLFNDRNFRCRAELGAQQRVFLCFGYSNSYSEPGDDHTKRIELREIWDALLSFQIQRAAIDRPLRAWCGYDSAGEMCQ